jgi:hypothetical protein
VASFDPVSTADPAPTAATQMTHFQYGIHKPKKFNDGTVCYACLATSGESYIVHKALSIPQWKSAMQDEYDALLQNQT